MAKSKTPSPQEVYRTRKAREEMEKSAMLPPGLVNHGNTCFMNSVLQGLIASQYLQLLVNFQPVPLPLPIASRRSPVLTNGHGLSQEHDQPWTDALPISDQLIAVLLTAWDIQYNRKREHISPRDLLAALGKKYDQYLDFRQQDAHEFLCQLLDAVRMEELDVINQRAPPKKKASKRSQSSRPHYPATLESADELESFVDMLFGGKLASILVCQACKKVSHTYEDFSDLCLSMKPEDYVRERKRDKLKQFAKRIGTAFYAGTPPQPRSSSVPATPIRDSNLDSPAANDTQRRRSIDLADVEIVVQPINDQQDPADVTRDDVALPVPPSLSSDSPSMPGTPTDIPQPVIVADTPAPALHQESSGDRITIVAPEKVNGKGKDKDESWARISRRISVSVGLTRRPKNERKDKKGMPSATPVKPADEEAPRVVSAPVTPDAVNGVAPPSPYPEKEPTPLGLVNEKLQAQLTNVKRSVMPNQRSSNSPSGIPAPRFPLISRPSSPGLHSKASKRPRAPKPSAEESAYLRDILADINPPNVPKPFSIFKQSKEPGSSMPTFNSQNIFLRVNQINRIEECLRLFTSVEVLDGDNTVRCHRCWKIANGFYKPRAEGSPQDPDSCSDSENDEDEPVDTKPNGDRPVLDPIPAANHALNIHTASSSHPASPSYSTASIQYTHASRDTLSSLTQPSTRGPSTHKPVPPALQLNDGQPIDLVTPIRNGMPTQTTLAVPSISTTAPESPMRTAKPIPIRTMTQTSATTTEYSSRISLSAPSGQHGFRSGDSNPESEISEAESEALLSIYSDVSSAASSNLSNASQDRLQKPSSTPHARAKDKRHPSGVPRSRQYILRPAYKRYLIATPPPILIVQLKRFQQLSKTPVVSFATGFKKLDDYISFPEYLDLAPYLAPRRDDYFDSKVTVTRGRARRHTPCMYRLYAVVVHIGNMLGGHYVAYTALPPSSLSFDGDTAPASQPTESEKQRPDNNGTAPGPAPRDWAFVSDTIVRLSSLEEVLKSKAYICMYERI